MALEKEIMPVSYILTNIIQEIPLYYPILLQSVFPHDRFTPLGNNASLYSCSVKNSFRGISNKRGEHN